MVFRTLSQQYPIEHCGQTLFDRLPKTMEQSMTVVTSNYSGTTGDEFGNTGGVEEEPCWYEDEYGDPTPEAIEMSLEYERESHRHKG